MVEDRKQKPNLWDKNQKTRAEMTQLEEIIFTGYSKAQVAARVFLFVCGFLCGVGTVLLLIK